MTIESTEDLKVINLFDIPLGKQSFTATVQKITKEAESDYFGNTVYVPYVCFKNIKVLVEKTWYKVESAGITIKSKIGKRLEKLNLESEDLVAFDAKVENEMIEFFNVEGKDDINEEIDGEPVEYLPKDYKGTIIVEFYETEFTPVERISKNNFTKVYNRRGFNKKYKNFYCKREANGKSLGYYKEPQAMYYQGKSIKNLSNIEKF